MRPGYAGGSNWGGVAVDPQRQVAVTNVNEVPALVRLIPRGDLERLKNEGRLKGWQITEQRGTPYYLARRIFLSPLNLPCTKPPWGKLVAVDLSRGKFCGRKSGHDKRFSTKSSQILDGVFPIGRGHADRIRITRDSRRSGAQTADLPNRDGTRNLVTNLPLPQCPHQ